MLTLLKIIGWIKSHWRPVLYIAAGVAVLLFAMWLRGCYVSYEQGKVTKDLNNANKQIDKSKNDSAVIEAERDRQRNEVVNAETNSNQALGAVNDARHADSSRSNGNISTARKRFCQLYPDDSLCRQ